MRCAPSLTPKQKRESDDSPILRHGFAVPPPLPKEANVTAGSRRHFVGDDAHIVPYKLTVNFRVFTDSRKGCPYDLHRENTSATRNTDKKPANTAFCICGQTLFLSFPFGFLCGFFSFKLFAVSLFFGFDSLGFGGCFCLSFFVAFFCRFVNR